MDPEYDQKPEIMYVAYLHVPDIFCIFANLQVKKTKSCT